jgi:hypothetical protein
MPDNITEISLMETFGIQANSIINELDEMFPPVTPGPGDTIQTIMYRSGQRSVIDWINNRLKE